MVIFIISVGVALTVSALCSLMEATLLSLTPAQVAEMTANYPRRGRIWQDFKNRIERPIAVILVLNTAAHTIGASVAGAQFNELYGDRWIWLFSVAFTYLMLQFTEILPKSLGVRFNRDLALVFARPLQSFTAVFSPIIAFIHWINRPFETRGRSHSRSATLEELSALAGLARLANQISPHQEKIIQGASRLSQLRVSQVMIPEEQVSFLSTSQSLRDAIAAAHVDSHTRFPVCFEGDHDRVVGYANFKEMIAYMRTNPNDQSFHGTIRPIHVAQPDQSVADLLRYFVDQHTHIAIVRNDHGRTIGLVTLEDILEEMVGELEDEFDRLPRMFHSLSRETWMVGGGTPIREVFGRLKLTDGAPQGTISAWMVQRLGRIPRPGDMVKEANVQFTVRRVRRGKVFEAAVTRVAAS